MRRAFGPASLVGTLNSIPIADYADPAVSLPGGAVAFIGASAAPPSAQIDPNWIKPASGTGGGGVIDASPIYGFPATSASAALAAPAFVPPLESQNARLAEFNRLGDTLPPGASNGTQTEFVSNELYIVSAPESVQLTHIGRASTSRRPRPPCRRHRAIRPNALAQWRRCSAKAAAKDGQVLSCAPLCEGAHVLKYTAEAAFTAVILPVRCPSRSPALSAAQTQFARNSHEHEA